MAARRRTPARPVTLPDVVATGDRRASLEALRDHLARQLANPETRDHAALSRQLREVIREIDELPTLQQESTLDDLANRRATRRAKAANQ